MDLKKTALGIELGSTRIKAVLIDDRHLPIASGDFEWENQLEYAVTMRHIHRFAGPGTRVLEVGAGTGRYAIAPAKEGMDVTAVELAEGNLAVLRENSRGVAGIRSFQGDATDLSRFEDGGL